MGQGEICACGSCLTLNRIEAANDDKIVGDTDESASKLQVNMFQDVFYIALKLNFWALF